MLIDWIVFIGSAVGLLLLIGIGEGLRAMGGSSRASRHAVHVGVGLFVVLTPYLFSGPEPVYVLAIVFVGINDVALRRGWFRGMHGAGRQSMGTVTFPLALIPALWACWTLDPNRQFALQTAFLVLAIADPVAAWVGTSMRQPVRFRMGTSVKSVAGSAAFLLGAFVLSSGALLLFRAQGYVDWSLQACVMAAILVAVVTTATEALGGHGWDNFFVVIAAIVVLVFFDEHPGARLRMLGGGAGGLIFGLVAFRLRVLNRSGAAAGGLLAATLIGLGGWTWAVPGFTFFVLSSALSKIGGSRKGPLARFSEKGSVRDAGQVYANGGIGWGLLLVYAVYPASGLYWGFLGAFAAAAADTWATEVGALSPRRPRSLRSGRPVPRGTSGAISVTGMLASLAGAASVAGSAWPVGGAFLTALAPGPALGVVLLGGWAGAMVDSWAGATLQAQYRDPQTGALTEHSGANATVRSPVRGWRAVTNDRVNLLGTLSGAAIAMGGCVGML